MLSSLGFRVKLSVLTIAIVIITVLCLSGSQIFMANEDALRQGRDGLLRISATLGEAVALQHTLMQNKLRIDRDIMRTQFELGGFPVPEVLMEAEMTLQDQGGGETQTMILPALKHGPGYLHENNSVARKVAELTGGVASILQVHEGRLVRVSTSLDAPMANWGQGSFMRKGNPAFDAIVSGQPWDGLVWLGGAWRMTAYVPFTDLAGTEVLGALEISHPLVDDSFARFVRGVGIGGHGGTLAFDAQGREIIGLSDWPEETRTIVTARPEANSAELTTPQGRRLEVALLRFEPWNLTFATWVATKDLMAGVKGRLIKNALVSMVLPLVLSVVLIGIASRVLLAPVRRMADLAEEVAAGNYAVNISYPARDSVGHLADTLNTMVGRSRDILAEIVLATESLSGASAELGAISKGLTDNSSCTARRARAVHDSARSVSGNMHSVSTAMEQTTVNVGTVAAAADELANTIHGVAQSADLARRTTSDAVTKAGGTTRHVEQLSQAAREINGVTATIAAISSQTHLLALNATIEAARAGAAGRGFAVVAGEIKELSQQTSAATENIRRKVSAMQSVTEITTREIGEIIAVIVEMNEIVISISEAMEEQATMTRDISGNIGQAAQGIAEINTNVTASSVMTSEISDEIEGVLSASNAMQEESALVVDRATGLAELSEHLQALVARFRF